MLCKQIDAYEQWSCSFSCLLREQVLDNYTTKRTFRSDEKTLKCQIHRRHALPVTIKAAHSITFLETGLLNTLA